MCEYRPGLPEAERGDSLIEILVALAVLSIGIVALIGAVAANATATSINRQQSQVETVLMAAAEYVKSVPLTAALCSSPSAAFNSSLVPKPTGYSVSFGALTAFPGQACADEATVDIIVSGDGFTLPALTVLKRA